MLIKEKLKVLLILIIATAVSLHFIIPGFFSSLVNPNNYDNHSGISLFYHSLRSVKSFNFTDIYHYPNYFPYGYVSTSGAIFIGQALLVLPLRIMGFDNIYLLNNYLIFISYFLGGLALYLFAKELINDKNSALIAGVVYILMPVKIQNLVHLNMIFFCFSIFSIYYLYRYLRLNNWTDLLFFGCFYFIQSLFDASYFFVLTILIPFYALIYLFIAQKLKIKSLLMLFAAGLISGGLAVLVYLPYIYNPLGFEFLAEPFNFNNLMASHLIFSYTMLNFVQMIPYSFPLFLGFASCVFIFFFFYKKSSNNLMKALSFLIFFSLFGSFLIIHFSNFNLDWLLSFSDISFIVFLLLLITASSVFWKYLESGEKFILVTLSFSLIVLFQGVYSFIPFELNLFRFLSNFISFFGRMRGIRIHYFFQIFWILFAVLGIRCLNNNKTYKKVFIVLIAILFIENFPFEKRVGALPGWSHDIKESYRFLDGYPDYYGVLELPHHNGGPLEYMYSLNTIFHNKQIYNGHFGVGIRDPLKIYRRGYFRGYVSIYNDIMDETIINYLRDRGIMILIAHRTRLADIPSKLYRWEKMKEAFQISKNVNLFKDIYIDEHLIIGIIAEKHIGSDFIYQLPYKYFRNKEKITFVINNEITGNNAVWTLNGSEIKNIVLAEGANIVEIKINSGDLFIKENYLKIISKSQIAIESMEVH